MSQPRPAPSTKPFLRALGGEAVWPPPVWLMRQAGRYLPEYRATRADAGGFLDLCYTPDFAVEVTLQPLRRYGFDAAILFSDILVVPHALGQDVAFKQGEGPVLDALKDEADLARLDTGRVLDHMRPVLETVSGLAKAIPETTALIGFAGAPWTVATYMIEGGGSKDFATTKAWAYGRPDLFGRLIDTLVTATGDYLIAQIDAGAEAIQIFDTWAGALPEADFMRWVVEPIGRIVRRIQTERPGIPVIGFPRGAGILYPTFVRETGVTGVSLDTSVPCAWAAEAVQPLAVTQGNLDPIHLVSGGDAQDVATDHILNTLCGTRPHIFNLGHGIVPQTPPENVARLMERIRGAARPDAV
ncbi:uroporphyrinogen decarboxylase [Roseospira marina]|uniref:uroporphyrinogen decarboxylase n=1 Tax=Roseospira marina TaxID=140057 RepID=UPI0017EDE301|nr:uroporphyrinogen decarboxylase [Roseospira marina]MBB4314392.1 uroporphyrinogen decarboxylase [Roseospira marina]MBB5087552.1 uroporphyrinogen decarboxylase [Roseospira marina]